MKPGPALQTMLLAFLAATTWLQAAPEVTLPPASGYVRIDEASVSAVPAWPALAGMGMEQRPPAQSVAGRQYRKLRPELLGVAPFPTGKSPSLLAKGESHGFALWELAAALKAPPGSALMLGFTIRTTEARIVYLGVGCSDQVVVFCNSQAVHGGSGPRELLFDQDIVPLQLQAGPNEISLHFQRFFPWQEYPANIFNPEWSAGLEIFSTAEDAWRGHGRNVYHPMDFPIVPDFDQIRIEARTEGHDAVSVFDLAGREVLSGRVMEEGRVAWNPHTTRPKLPFVGTLVVGGNLGEPILVCAESEIIQVGSASVRSAKSTGKDSVWQFRLEHLLKPEHREIRDVWWQRKLLGGLYRVEADRVGNAAPPSIAFLPSLRVDFGEYRSVIDGTRQYYRVFRCRDRQARTPPLLVSLPYVPLPFRTFLEGTTVANQKELEQLASVADEWGVDVIWPGIVDADYGGTLMYSAIQECIAHANANSPAHTYVMGMCSGGVGAIGYAKAFPVDGLILQSPVVNRKYSKWLPGVNSIDPHYPPAIADLEQTERHLELLARLPVKLDYDIDILGHGDREKSAALEKTLRAHQGKIDATWRPVPLNFFPWGERRKAVIASWCQWINAVESDRSKQKAAPPLAAEGKSPAENRPPTVKSTLLRGFVLTQTHDPVFSRWQKGWLSVYQIYRGAIPTATDLAGGQAPITFRVLTAQEQDAGSLAKLFSGTPQVAADSLTKTPIDSAARLFGFRLVQAASVTRVEMIRSGGLNLTPPALDLLLDGGCRGALWKQTGETWVLVEVWL